MLYFTWEPDLKIGIEVIDAQHLHIIDSINELNQAFANCSEAEVGRMLDRLVEYIHAHFAFEECLLERVRYPYLEAHRQIHRAFAIRVHDYRRSFHRGDTSAGKKLLADLTIWLTNHIKHEDEVYTEIVLPYLQNDADSDDWLATTLTRLFGDT
ncbi:MAG: bacteriohemerythrin [Gammaproteobacteria bacterium]